MKKTKKPLIWFVDDLPENLDSFQQAHKDQFEIKTFHSPTDLLGELDVARPDAVLCDIFFYDTVKQAKNIENKINAKVDEMKEFAHKVLKADEEKYLAGIKLIEEIYEKYNKNPPFPIYAYTSKGPYLLDNWDRIINSKAKILPKNKLGAHSTQLEITTDIKRYAIL